jgi:hypothetical protein
MMANCYSRNMSPIQCVCDNKLTCGVGRRTATKVLSVAELWPVILATHLRRLLIKWNAPESTWRFDSSFPVERGKRESECVCVCVWEGGGSMAVAC